MVFIIKLIDRYLGGIICNFLALLNKLNKRRFIKRKLISRSKIGGKISGIDSILVIQLWGIGESILALPAIEALRKRFPKARIDILATQRNSGVFFNNKSPNHIFSLKLNPISILKFILASMKKYDLVIDMEEYLNISAIIAFFTGARIVGYSHNSRAKLYTYKVKYNDGQHAVQAFLDLVRKLNVDYDANSLPKLNFSKPDKKLVDKLLANNGFKSGELVVCVAPGVAESAKSRMWPYDRYAELCEEIIARHDAKIVFVGTSGEGELISSIQTLMDRRVDSTPAFDKSKDKTINSAGKTTLNQLFYLISKCSLFIGNDAGAMHVAAAQGIKTIGLFGPNLPIRFGPYGRGNIGLYKGYNCEFSPCINVHKGEVPDCLYPRESNDYQKCMKNISVDDVLKEVANMLHNEKH